MRNPSPYVIVLAAAADRLGRSTLAENLAVYLKGLAEELPVAVLSFDRQHDLAQTFALSCKVPATLQRFIVEQKLEDQLAFGQFGVEYLSFFDLSHLTPKQILRLLRESNYPGILIVDSGPLEEDLAMVALQVADLLIVPVQDAAGLTALAEIRRELQAGGGNDQMLWLIPSMVEDPQEQARQLEFLRFAANERGYQVLDDEFVRDAQLPERTRGVGGSVLTRMPNSQAHQLLHRLAQLALQQFEEGSDSSCRLQRLVREGVLGSRFHRVEVRCPLCNKLACFSDAHYCESLPYRKRWLMHTDCLSDLIAGSGLKPFWGANTTAVVRTGVESSSLLPKLRLLLADAAGGPLESELIEPESDSNWKPLIRFATGLTLAEQFPALLMLYPAADERTVLTKNWYQKCVNLRKKLRSGLATEL